MGTTPNYAWPYPELTDPPDGATQIKSLANAADTTTKGIDTRLGVMEAPTIMRVSRAAASPQSVSNTTYTLMSFPTKDEDLAAMANAAGDQFTIKKAGIWTASLLLTWAANATGFRIAWIYVNGASVIGQAGSTGGSYGFPNNVSGNLRLAVNDIVTVQGYQSSGAALNTGSPGPSFSLLWQRS